MANPIQLGPKDKIAPTPVNGTTIGTSVYPTEADAQWQATTDDTNGIGLWQYQIYRNGIYWGAGSATSFSDTGLSPGTIYTYTIYAEDWHFNLSAGTSFSVTTPSYGPNPAVVTPPARTGVHSVGSYWGAAGEQIDMLSGNLNFTLPLFKAMGRGAWGQTFALNYNSQLWRLDSGGTWNLGRDVGYGWGWRLMAGSIAPYWSDAYTIQYYLFTDSTGAEYKLDINTSGIWTSSQAAYLTYDGANQLLYFPDGSFWKMACYSAGTEPDAGTRYPTIMQDTNGNQVLIRYQTGAGAPWSNSSARITEVEDVRAVLDGSTGTYRSWAFTYNTDSTPHLTGITNYLGTAESYTFAYLTNQSLSSPFQPPVSYPATTLLQTVTNAAQLTHTFEFAGGSGEMSKVTFPYGGMMRWAYRSFTYGGGKTDREVQYRYLTMSSGGTESTYTLTRDDADNPNNPVNGYTCVADPSGIGQNCWFFNTTSSSWMMGLNTSMEQRPAAGQTATQRKDITWVQDAALSPYIGTVLTTLDPSGANLQTKTTQVLDIHGNVTQTAIYDYGNLTTPARTYTNTYLTNTNYTSIGIWNRLQTSTVTNGTQNVTLVTNTYDGNSLTSVSVVREYVGVGTYRGNLTSSVVPGATTNIFYDITGAVVSRNDGQGHTLAVTQSSTTNFAAPDVITVNGDSHSNQNMTYTPWLATSTVTGPNSASASMTYDSKARPATRTSVDGAVTTYGYSASGVVPYVITATTNSHWTQTTLDGFGRTAKSVRGTGSTTISEVDTVYGPCACSPIGKMTQVSQPYVPGNTVYWTKYTYDGLGRTVSVLSPDAASTTTYAYSGNTTTITDPAGKWKKQTTDAMGNLKQVNEPNPVQGADYVTSYTYDLLSHLTQVSMPRPSGTQTRTFVYDPTTQRLSSETHPESGTKSYTYNADGTVATRTDARGVITHYTYDSFQRVSLIQDGTTCEQVNLTYDQGTNGWGRPYTSTWGGATCAGGYTFVYSYGYTSAGRVTAKTLSASRTAGTQTLSAAYTYDNEGHVTSIAYPNVSTGLPSTIPYNYTFDGMGRQTGLSFTNNGVVTQLAQNVQYGPSDELLQATYQPAAYGETRHYNSRLQLTEIQTGGLDFQYVYSSNQNNGRILQAIGTGGTVSYTYDTLNRLATASSSGSWAESFTYDGFGNLTDKTPTAGSPPALHITVNAATNRINGDSYDANGNVTSSPQGGGQYDGENRLIGSAGDTYSYGPDNRRVYKKKPNGAETLYFYGLGGELLQEGGYNHVYFAGKAIDGYRDRLGSVRGLGPPPPPTTSYYPYGEEYTTTAQDMEKFATYYRDGTTGLDYAKNRYYSSILGRFMSADPYMASVGPADPGSWNRYAYTRNDPVNRVDLSGLDDCIPSPGIDFCATGTAPAPGDSGGNNQNSDVAYYPHPPVHQIPGLMIWNDALYKASSATEFILEKTSWSPDCQKDLAEVGTTVSALQGAAFNADIENGATSDVKKASLYKGDAAQAGRNIDPTLTISQDMSQHGGIGAESDLNGNRIFINPMYFHQIGSGYAIAVIAHELLHNITGMVDSSLQTALGLPTTITFPDQRGIVPAPSNNISVKLVGDCFGH